jgi:hypothetical protein
MITETYAGGIRACAPRGETPPIGVHRRHHVQSGLTTTVFPFSKNSARPESRSKSKTTAELCQALLTIRKAAIGDAAPSGLPAGPLPGRRFVSPHSRLRPGRQNVVCDLQAGCVSTGPDQVIQVRALGVLDEERVRHFTEDLL